MIVDIGDVAARVNNAGMNDEEAEALIEGAALSAANEIRERLRHGRQVEKDLYQYRRECDERQQEVAANNRLGIARQEQDSRDRNKILSAAEDINGPIRRGKYGLPHSS